MSDKTFIDTNILIYAHDKDAGQKYLISSKIIRDLWEHRTGIISTQILQEFYVNVTRKIANPIPKPRVREIIESYMAWHVELNDVVTLLAASEIEERHQLSFWDALVVAAASNAKADRLITEDLNHGQTIEGIMIHNPFTEIREDLNR